MLVRRAIILITLQLLFSSAFAATLGVRYGFDFGGDTLAKLNYTNGWSDTLTAGGGEHLEIGLEFNTPLLQSKHLSTELSIGHKYHFIAASNFEADFERYSASIVQYYNRTNPRIGIGATRHFLGKYQQKGSLAPNGHSNINISHGLIFLVDYQFRRSFRFGSRVTLLNYTDYGQRIEADSVGFFISYQFKN